MESDIGFFLKGFKYGDTSQIIHFYTQKNGRKSVIYKGANRSKKKKALLPLLQVELITSNNPKSNLDFLKEFNYYTHYQSLYVHPVKSLICQFISEILYLTLQTEEENVPLFGFIQAQLDQLDQKKTNFADFHIFFILNLTRYLGFYPNIQNINKTYFDLQEGSFENQIQSSFTLSESQTHLWKKMVQSEWNLSSINYFSQNQRQQLLDNLLTFYQLHLPNFKVPNSVEILKHLFA